MVYVISLNSQSLMPTNRYAKVRILLKKKLATVVQVKPFTIKLNYEAENITQDITLGIDSGYLNIGFSAITNKKELISGEVKLLKGMKDRITEKLMYRKQRRSRLRHRSPRFNNRKIPKGWLAPSVQHKLDSHIRFIEKLRKILPITKIIVEVANFDIQKIKDANIKGKKYQEGEQKDFGNIREYVLHRDNHKCQNPNCTNKDEYPILKVHHIKFRSKGGTDTPNNLITLCSKCHTPINHKKGYFLYDWCEYSHKVKQFKDATFMSMVRLRLVDYLNSINIETKHTYGSITKSNRINLKLEKTHYNDAFCIAGGSIQKKLEPIIYIQTRRNNRNLEKFYDKKVYDIRTKEITTGKALFNGRTTRNKSPQGTLYGCDNKIFTVAGAQNKGVYTKLKDCKKVVKTDLLTPYKFSKGICII